MSAAYVAAKPQCEECRKVWFPVLDQERWQENHAHELLLDLPVPDPLEGTLGVQLDVLLDEGVRTAVFWVGENSDLITREKVKNPNGRTVSQHK
jgi:hypothetical protein